MDKRVLDDDDEKDLDVVAYDDFRCVTVDWRGFVVGEKGDDNDTNGSAVMMVLCCE